ncbi:hypothetical protein FACS189465_0370 [Clostridia bacterium]|nr:hypothetical protein FACS189465_0370 [Clostridia bacterium]
MLDALRRKEMSEYLIEKSEVAQQYENAKEFLKEVKNYLSKNLKQID